MAACSAAWVLKSLEVKLGPLLHVSFFGANPLPSGLPPQKKGEPPTTLKPPKKNMSPKKNSEKKSPPATGPKQKKHHPQPKKTKTKKQKKTTHPSPPPPTTPTNAALPPALVFALHCKSSAQRPRGSNPPRRSASPAAAQLWRRKGLVLVRRKSWMEVGGPFLLGLGVWGFLDFFFCGLLSSKAWSAKSFAKKEKFSS